MSLVFGCKKKHIVAFFFFKYQGQIPKKQLSVPVCSRVEVEKHLRVVKLKANHCFTVVHVLFYPLLSLALPVFLLPYPTEATNQAFFFGRGLKIPSCQAVLRSPCHHSAQGFNAVRWCHCLRKKSSDACLLSSYIEKIYI